MTVGESAGLAQFEILRSLGRGTMAEVLLARGRDAGQEGPFALKVLKGFAVGGPEVVERVVREAEAVREVSSPNVAAVQDAFVHGGVPHVVSELVRGGSLVPLLGEPWGLAPAAGVLQEVLEALAAADARGIVHGDLNPKNVLLTSTGRVRVTDFGLATVAWGSGGDGASTPGLTVGTPAYMSPEHALGSQLGPASDLYSVGCLAFELLTGHVPFDDPDQMAVLQAHVQEAVPDLRQVDPKAPRALARWLARMVDKAPEARFEDAATAWEELEEAVIGQLGTLWQTDAGIEPESSLDLDELEEARPVRPEGVSLRRAPAVAAAGGFEAYQAPITLHEQQQALRAQHEAEAAEAARLAAEAAAAAALLEPEPEPEVEEEPEEELAPVQAAPEVERPTVRVAPAVEEPPKPLWPVAVVGVLALAVTFGVAFVKGGPATPVSVKADGVTLRAPAGWKRADPRGAVVSLGAKAIALAPPGGGRREAVVAARVRPNGPNLLPPALAAEAVGSTVQVDVGEGEALRRELEVGGRRVVTYSLATSTGGVVVACPVTPAVLPVCPGIAGSLGVSGKVLKLGASDEGAQALSGALNRLRDAVRGPNQDLTRARTQAAQSVAASDVSLAYSQAAAAIDKADLGVRAGPARDRLTSALKGVADGWKAYAAAAGAGRSGGTVAARLTVQSATARAASARDELASLGYRSR